MTSGGDAAGMNPAVKCVSDYAVSKGLKPYLVEWGLRGLIDDLIYEASQERLSGILHRGGTALGSSRSKRFFEIDYRRQAFENLERKGITKLVVIGGDGSFRALNQFYSDFGIPFAGIPATIDNDIPGTDYCLGVDTALNMILSNVDSIRDTAASFRRAFVVETMGRDCGYLAMVSAMACGAEVCLVPEVEYDLKTMATRLLAERDRGRRYVLAIVAEGTGKAQELTEWLGETLDMDARLTVLGHVQRGGSPSAYDRLMAYRFSVGAVDALLSGEKNHIVTYRGGTFSHLPITEVAGQRHQVEDSLIEMCRSRSC